MTEFGYSNKAINVLNKFHKVDIVIYVEGPSDIPFWKVLFEKFSDYSFKLKDVGGCNEIKKYIPKILSGEICVAVACDSDFLYVEEGITQHPNLVRSYGYSIENSMFSVSSIKKVIQSMGLITASSVKDDLILQWIEDLYSSTEKLIINDIANYLLGTGKEVTGDNCSRFTKSKKSHELCKEKISAYILKLNLEIDNGFEGIILERLAGNNREINDLLRGHFLLSVALKYVVAILSKTGTKVSLSKNAFFGALILAFENVFNENHSHYDYYLKSVSNVQVIA